jgi:4-hydroxy-tetrahydrodipicolinate synthase
MARPIRGIFNILATPFDTDQQVDLDSLRRLVNFQLDLGVHGLTILGVLGEAAKLTLDERTLVMNTVIETVAGRVPVVVGTSHVSLDTCIALTKAAFGATMLAHLAEQIPTARYLKLEDPPLMEKIGAIREQTDQFEIFGGLGGMFLLEELKRGASGTMTGFAFSEVLIAVYDAFVGGRMKDAEAIFDHYLPLIRYENQPVINLTLRKHILYRRGAIANSTPRNPFPAVSAGSLDEIEWMFERVGISDPTQKINF